ncbi:MAG TPA: cbb3-type cytochrome c oxidase subunit I [Gemmatimonadales bacterium]|nr:cbb3-type cytochrome c oxidase subunit I [Gemmatimonadales bacterium]
MSPLVRRFLKTAIAFLIFGVGLGVFMLARREIGGVWSTPWWISAHTHTILVGFVMMMIMGVVLWMFPRPPRDDTHFDPRLAEAAYWCIAVGTGVRLSASWRGPLRRPWRCAGGGPGGVAQALGLVLFFYTMWTRIRGRPDG